LFGTDLPSLAVAITVAVAIHYRCRYLLSLSLFIIAVAVYYRAECNVQLSCLDTFNGIADPPALVSRSELLKGSSSILLKELELR
jgi:hypothetical protein